MLAVKYVVINYGAVAALPVFGPGIYPLCAAVLIFKEELSGKAGLSQPVQSFKEGKAVEGVMVIMVPALAQGNAYGVFALFEVGGYIMYAILYALVVCSPAWIQNSVALLCSVYADDIIAYSRN